MAFNFTAYQPLDTPVHRIDARVKIVVLLAYSIALFAIHSWWGLAIFAVLFGIVAAVSRLPLRSCARQLVFVWILLGFTLLFNAFAFDPAAAIPSGVGGVSSGIFDSFAPIQLVGSFYFIPAGFVRGCFYVLRLALLVFASLILTSTTMGEELTGALASFLSPLRRFRVPVDDVATVVSIALRFIPLIVDEFQGVCAAQVARGGRFDSGPVLERLKAWETVLIPLFLGLYRRADNLALAMDSRCYGVGRRTALNARKFTSASALSMAGGVTICALIGALL